MQKMASLKIWLTKDRPGLNWCKPFVKIFGIKNWIEFVVAALGILFLWYSIYLLDKIGL